LSNLQGGDWRLAGERGDNDPYLSHGRQEGDTGQDTPSGSRRYGAHQPLAYRRAIDACYDADLCVRTQRDEDKVRQEQRIERHGDDVSRVVVQRKEERAQPAKQADEFATAGKPQRPSARPSSSLADGRNTPGYPGR